ncbi:hypothetical protein NFX39_05880 [Fructobacillus sp. W13]|uniref:Phage protein n=1 Tax=Fructobacillus apis TaxID=2935017 RepID=A0ABT0ZRI7_9LACO|nr:hypothetical protein [Fructobacillus apis]MCO0832606.1 hypothetical protein [Fructobacillus apis]
MTLEQILETALAVTTIAVSCCFIYSMIQFSLMDRKEAKMRRIRDEAFIEYCKLLLAKPRGEEE